MNDFVLPRIKVCGLRTPEAVAAAVEAGADALGFIQHPGSPRAVDARAVKGLLAGTPASVTSVGVFVDAKPGPALAWCREAGVGAIQLCGKERPADWEGFALPILRRVAVELDAEGEMKAWSEVADGFVLDHPSGHGGTGQPVDLRRAAGLAARGPCLLAGGLDAHTVVVAVGTVQPAGVDASSRLERATGVKDPERIRAFVEAARGALGVGAR